MPFKFKRRSSQASEAVEKRDSSEFQRPARVIVTGTTGNLGAYLVDYLLAQDWIQHVVCLNRSAKASERQWTAHSERGLATDSRSAPGKVTFLQADFADKKLGLGDDVYANLARTSDLVIHNAWPVDFNRHFESFRSSIEGVNHLIKFCVSQPKTAPAKLLFISSVGAISNWGSAAPTSRSKIPEVEIRSWTVARTGYGQSKLVCERLIAKAAQDLGLNAAVVRVGQLAGPVSYGDRYGKWTEREWLPSLIRSSAALNALPQDLGPVEAVDWVPVDLCAHVVTEISRHLRFDSGGRGVKDKESDTQFFHIVNPYPSTWSSLVPAIQQHMPKTVRLVPFTEWVAVLKRSSADFEGVDEGKNPAVKLVDFFDSMRDRAERFPKSRAAELETKRTVAVSRTLADLKPVVPEWMDLWMRQWHWVM